MKLTRFVLTAAVCGAAVFAIVQACGGQLTVGYDDAGNYHTADGAIWKVGAACEGWDAAHYLVEGGYACDPNNDQCQQWIGPPGWWRVTACVVKYVVDDAGNEVVDDGGHSIIGDAAICSDQGSIISNVAQCDQTDPKADDLCSAFWSQFVTHGHVLGKCAGFGGYCGMQSFNADCTLGLIRTDDDGGTACVPPCAP